MTYNPLFPSYLYRGDPDEAVNRVIELDQARLLMVGMEKAKGAGEPVVSPPCDVEAHD